MKIKYFDDKNFVKMYYTGYCNNRTIIFRLTYSSLLTFQVQKYLRVNVIIHIYYYIGI